MIHHGEKQRRNTGGLMQAWKPGQSGNPKGRPPKGRCFTDAAREMLSAKEIDIFYTAGDEKIKRLHLKSSFTLYHGLVAALIQRGLNGDVAAIKELIDRAEGKVTEHIPEADKDIKIEIEYV